ARPQRRAPVGSLELGETRAASPPRLPNRPAPLPEAPSTSRIGRYIVLRKLGEGGMGEVFACYDEELDRSVAIKLVRRTLAGDTLGQARMQREARAMAQLSHPNVVQVHDVGTFGDQLFIAMEFVRGETLRVWAKAQAPSDERARRRIIDMFIQAGHGLQAAHDRGLVHRDFKPDNVLVSDDGRARVLDFGLAVPQRSEGKRATVEGGQERALVDSALTMAGVVVGTPAYMAPEQFMALETDARSDQFSFCVALYEALYGELPFTGRTFVEREQSVTRGLLRKPPKDTRVPGWLRAVLVRGLSRAPEDRYPTMAALIEALVDDPIARRRRQRKTLGALASVMALSVLAIFGGMEAWERWQSYAREQAARDRLATLERHLVELREAGAEEEASRSFAAFVEAPENRGTQALGMAWLHAAERATAEGMKDAAVDAFATSYAVSTSREHQTASLIGLARHFRSRLQVGSLIRATATLKAEGRPSSPSVTREIAELEFDTALARHDLEGALRLTEGPLAGTRRAAFAGVLRALAPATRTELAGISTPIAPVDIDGDGRVELLVKHSGGAVALRAAPELDVITRLCDACELVAVPPTPGAPARFLKLELPGQFAQGTLRLVRRSGDAFVEDFAWADFKPLAIATHDLDMDGAPSILVGTGPYSRHLVELAQGEGDAWSLRSPSPAIDSRGSDILDFVVGDVDGDARPELVLAHGSWRAFELVVARHEPRTGYLTPFIRRKVGMGLAVALLGRGAGPPEIALYKNDEAEQGGLLHGLGEDDQKGLHLFRVRDDALERTFYAPSVGEGAHHHHVDLRVGDLDGDGRDELVLWSKFRGHEPDELGVAVQIFVQQPDGALSSIVIDGLILLGVHDLDGDGDSELIVATGDLTNPGEVWTLGAGAARLPATELPAAARDEVAISEPALAPMWGRARDLEAMGLGRHAAESYTRLGESALDTELRARAYTEAARICVELGDDALAAKLHTRAARHPAYLERAGLAAAACLERRGELDEARTLLRDLLTRGDASEATRAAFEATQQRIAAQQASAYEMDLSRSLGPEWRIASPLSLHRDPVARTLQVDAIGVEELAALPLVRSGDAIGLQVEFDVSRIEWNSTFELALRGADEQAIAGVRISGTGGDKLRNLLIVCLNDNGSLSEVQRVESTADGVGRRFRVRAIVSPEGEASCLFERVEQAGPVEIRYARSHGHAPADGDLRLDLRASGTKAWSRVSLHQLRLTGVSPQPGASPSARDPLVQRLVDGDHVGALALLNDATPAGFDEALWRVVSLSHLSRVDEAAEALRALDADPAARPRLEEALTRPLRGRASIMGPIVRAAFGRERYHALLVDAWGQAAFMALADELPLLALQEGLADLDADLGVEPANRVNLYVVRGRARRALGLYERAHEDFAVALAAMRDELEPAIVEVTQLGEPRTAIRFEMLLSAAAMGDIALARVDARALLEGARDPEYYREVIRTSKTLAPFYDALMAADPPG
ncbi:MAG: protein kinase, partial [Myxococcales bacterium]|nr:protein kinase [Myxococcales bacterium]